MQKSVALSSAEAEYYLASEIAIEIIYLRTLLANMQLRQSDYTPVFEDNTARASSEGGRDRSVGGSRDWSHVGPEKGCLGMARAEGPSGHQLKIRHLSQLAVVVRDSDEWGLIESR